MEKSYKSVKEKHVSNSLEFSVICSIPLSGQQDFP